MVYHCPKPRPTSEDTNSYVPFEPPRPEQMASCVQVFVEPLHDPAVFVEPLHDPATGQVVFCFFTTCTQSSK